MKLEQILESILFVSETPLRLSDFMALFERVDALDVEVNELLIADALQRLQQQKQQPDCIYELAELAGGYQLRTKPAYGKYARLAVLVQENKRLSRAALETLSIIAYRQPVARSEVEYIRGVNCDYAITKLLDKQLIEIAGRADTPGKPLLYKTSAYFMEYFGLKRMDDLPKIKELNPEDESTEAFKTPETRQ
ncbi:MAG: SMC-Scp complex subunit ScpB [Bacteroidetes bacterium]|jgi:segregation and condensation protein B|nr:SMC-Scp complex subunit ScpB [Bacteroidota bacterium]